MCSHHHQLNSSSLYGVDTWIGNCVSYLFQWVLTLLLYITFLQKLQIILSLVALNMLLTLSILGNSNTVYDLHHTSACRRANGFNFFSVIRVLAQERSAKVANPINSHLSGLQASPSIQIAVSKRNAMKMVIEIYMVYKCIVNEHSRPFVESEMM